MGRSRRRARRDDGLLGVLARRAEQKVREGRRAATRDQTADEVAKEVYETCVAVRGIDDGTPLILRGPAYAIAYRAAPAIVRTNGLPRDEQTLQDIAAYIVVGISAMIAGFEVEHFQKWSAENLEGGDEPES